MSTASQRGPAPSRALAETLRTAIETGALPPGAKLPSERSLAAEHGIARNTAREAIRLLAEAGLVDAQHGRGVFVRQPQRLLRYGRDRYSAGLREQTGLSPFRAEVLAQGRTPSVDCRSISVVPAPDFVATRLGVPEGSEVVRRENWYYADDVPVQVGHTYIPLKIAGDSQLATSVNLGEGSLYARFQERGYTIHSSREEVTARMPTSDETAGLAIPDGVPVISLIHTGLTDTQQPFEVTHFVMRADQNGLDYTMEVEQ